MLKLIASVAVLAAAFVTPSFADVIPYANVGHEAPAVLTYASGQGITVYFYGSDASYADTVEIVDLVTSYDSGPILPNHSTALGASATYGATGTVPSDFINAGDQLEFFINSPEGKFSSIAANSPDHANHAYITTYSGGTLNSVNIPAGLYVGLEDLDASHADYNYTDDTFVFTGVSSPSLPTGPAVPEPSSLMLFGTGMLSAAGIVRRRISRS